MSKIEIGQTVNLTEEDNPFKPGLMHVREVRNGIPVIGSLSPEDLLAAKLVVGKLGSVLGDAEALSKVIDDFSQQHGTKYEGNWAGALFDYTRKRIGHAVGKTNAQNKRRVALELNDGINAVMAHLSKNLSDETIFTLPVDVDSEKYMMMCPFMNTGRNWQYQINLARPKTSGN